MYIFSENGSKPYRAAIKIKGTHNVNINDKPFHPPTDYVFPKLKSRDVRTKHIGLKSSHGFIMRKSNNFRIFLFLFAQLSLQFENSNFVRFVFLTRLRILIPILFRKGCLLYFYCHSQEMRANLQD